MTKHNETNFHISLTTSLLKEQREYLASKLNKLLPGAQAELIGAGWSEAGSIHFNLTDDQAHEMANEYLRLKLLGSGPCEAWTGGSYASSQALSRREHCLEARTLLKAREIAYELHKELQEEDSPRDALQALAVRLVNGVPAHPAFAGFPNYEWTDEEYEDFTMDLIQELSTMIKEDEEHQALDLVVG